MTEHELLERYRTTLEARLLYALRDKPLTEVSVAQVKHIALEVAHDTGILDMSPRSNEHA